ncbi:MAG: HPF/RaiA family ribosome-associated protein [Candidatus Omnitrophica bacterium]|nr:HPF/RaiA family ribosome-associated protein [Candidatus Omnitrophota bacterium]
MSFSWHLVTRHIQPHAQLQERLRRKIAVLEKHLQRFPPEAVHLQIYLERNHNLPLFTAALTLRLPSNILRSEKTTVDPVSAFDHAVKALVRELEDFKAHLRRENQWNRVQRRTELRAAKATRFAPEPMAVAADSSVSNDVIPELVKRYYSRLLRHVHHELRQRQASGDVPARAIDPRGVVDQVVQEVLMGNEVKPEEMSYRLWLFLLARRELRERCRRLHQQGIEDISLEKPVVVRDESEKVEGYDAEQPLDILEQNLEPPVVETAELLPSDQVSPPDELLAETEFLEYLDQTIQSWPQTERTVFELHFLEGFDETEIAMLIRLPSAEVGELIGKLRQRLRQSFAS